MSPEKRSNALPVVAAVSFVRVEKARSRSVVLRGMRMGGRGAGEVEEGRGREAGGRGWEKRRVELCEWEEKGLLESGTSQRTSQKKDGRRNAPSNMPLLRARLHTLKTRPNPPSQLRQLPLDPLNLLLIPLRLLPRSLGSVETPREETEEGSDDDCED